MTSLPSDDQIRARAEELQLLAPGAALSPEVRRRVAKQLLEEAQRPEEPAAAAGAELQPVLLSRLTQPATGGLIRVDVLFIPNPPQEGKTP